MTSRPKTATPIAVAPRTMPTRAPAQRAVLPSRVLQSSRIPQQLCFQFTR